MRFLSGAAALALSVSFAVPALAQLPTVGGYKDATGAPQLGVGAGVFGLDSGSGQRCVIGATSTCQMPTSGGGGGGGNVNLTGINGVAPLVGAGATGTGSPRATQAQDTSTIAGSAPGTAGSASPNVVTVQGIASGTALPVADASVLSAVNSATPAGNFTIGATGYDPAVVPVTSAPINISTATTTQIVALSSGKFIYVSGGVVMAGGTGNITFEYGTGTACATGTTVLGGAMPLVANVGFIIPDKTYVVPASNALCVLTSAAVQYSGTVGYVQK